MKFVKANMVLVICGVVILLALIALYWPLSPVKASVTAAAAERLSAANTGGLNVNITIPFGPKPFMGPPTQGVIDARKAALAAVKKQADEILVQAGNDNQRGRITGPAAHPVPLLNGTPEPFLLPAISRGEGGSPFRFKSDYNHQFAPWLATLTGSGTVHAVAPVFSEISQQYDAARVGGQGAADQAAIDAKNAFIRAEVAKRAGEIKMYVDDDALQRERDWADSNAEPTPDQIFVAVVETWLQKDMIDAITAVNGKSTNVGDSPIKRLERITIGGDGGIAGGVASAGRGGLFFEPVSITDPKAAPTGTGLDPNRTLTGHVGGATYDTVLVGIVADIDPAYQNRFIDEIYRRNNGYTVLDIRTTAVDPYEAASNGYLYGKTQVVHVEMLVEALLYRSWTVPLMPPGIRAGGGTVGGTSGGNRPAPGGGGTPRGGGNNNGSGSGSNYVPPVNNSL